MMNVSKNSLSDKITRKIQKIDLEIYEAFRKCCEENNLRFFAISGTALGVSLWGGFIPWDDDMDIAMPIEDFEKFKRIIKTRSLEKKYRFIDFPWLGGKLYDSTTTMIEAPYAFSSKKYYGVFLDIVPLIGVPDDPSERRSFVNNVKKFIIEATASERAPELSVFTGMTNEIIKDWRKRLISSYPFGTTKYCVDLSNIKGSLYITEGFLNPKEAKFENTIIPISSKQEEDLVEAYGEVVKDVPKEERRLTHHDFYCYCDLSKPLKDVVHDYESASIPHWLREISKKCQIYGVSSAREAGLYKLRLKEIEQELQDCNKQLQEHRDEIDAIKKSGTYKVGALMTAPIRLLRKIL